MSMSKEKKKFVRLKNGALMSCKAIYVVFDYCMECQKITPFFDGYCFYCNSASPLGDPCDDEIPSSEWDDYIKSYVKVGLIREMDDNTLHFLNNL